MVTEKLIDLSLATTMSPTFLNDFHPRLPTEAQEAGQDLQVSLVYHKLY